MTRRLTLVAWAGAAAFCLGGILDLGSQRTGSLLSPQKAAAHDHVPATVAQTQPTPSPDEAQATGELQEGRQLFEVHCSVCHTLDLPRAQRLDLANWRWVIEDMVKFGMTWLTEEQQELIAEYLAEEHGPPARRR